MRISDRGPGGLKRGLIRAGTRPPNRALVFALWFVSGIAAGIFLAGHGLVERAGTALVEEPQRLHAEISYPTERLTLDVSHLNLQRLAYERKVAIERGVLVQSADAWVAAKIRFDDRTHDAKIRLKGDLVDQFAGGQWAFRVRLKGDDALFGMQVFSLHQPSARNYVYEWILHQMMRDEGLLGLRYRFVELVLNGTNLGIYALEEHFDKRLVESNARPEGPILGISEDADVESIRHFGWPTSRRVSYEGQPVQVYREKRTLADERLRGMFYAAHDLLAAFLAGERRADEVFALDEFARFYAILDLTNGRHAAKYGNLKLYYNPVTSRLEPICYDAEFVGKPATWTYGDGIYAETWRQSDELLEFSALLFRDPGFFARYVAELERMASEQHLQRFFERHGEEIQRLAGVNRRSLPTFRASDTSFYGRAARIREILSGPVALAAYPASATSDEPSLDVLNVSPMHLIIDAYRRAGQRIALAPPISVPAAAPGEVPELRRILLPPQPPAGDDELVAEAGAETTLEYRIAGASRSHTLVVASLPRRIDPERLNDLSRADANPRAFPFVTFAGGNAYRVEAGDWTLDRSLVLPPGASLEIGPGTSLALSAGASIVARGPLRFLGTAEAGIRIDGGEDGGGILLLDTAETSRFSHVSFTRLSAPVIAGTPLNGAFTAYQAPIVMQRCVFSANRSEDALNVVRSTFEISDSAFERTPADALDSDFSTGSVERTRFVEIGNDGIDVSGTILSLSDVEVVQAGDKAISAGEQSFVRGSTARLLGCEIGLAAKDRSEIRLARLMLGGGRLGIAVFQKKPEFGAALVAVDAAQFAGVEQEYLLESPSMLLLNHSSMPANVDRVEPLLYGVRYGKPSAR